MPISAPATGADLAPVSSRRTNGLTLDFGRSERGPAFRELLAEATPPAPVDPIAIAPAAPVPPPALLEGADALAQLRNDLLSGSGAILETPALEATPDEPAADNFAAAGTGAGDDPYLSAPPVPEADPPAGADPADEIRATSWRNDEVKGRRLGDGRAAGSEAGDQGGDWLFGEDGFTFGDVVDAINPLQHIPVVSSIYRWITGDEIAPAASMAGGALFGGPLGLAGAAAGVAIKEATGRDIGGHAMAMVFGDGAETMGDAPAAPSLAAAPLQLPGELGSIEPAASLPLASAETAQAPAVFIPFDSRADDGSSYVPVPRVGASAARAQEAAADLPPGDPIAAEMMQALRKYDALLKSRSSDGPAAAPAAGSLYDNSL